MQHNNHLRKNKQAKQQSSRLTTPVNDLLTQLLRFVASDGLIVEIQNMVAISISNYPTIN